jgi:hypothetical protein
VKRRRVVAPLVTLRHKAVKRRRRVVAAREAVTVLYRELLGRDPDEEGLAGHVAAIENGHLRLADVPASLRDTAEALSGLARSPTLRESRRALWADRVNRPLEGRPVFVLHIMKTGGTSLVHGLRRLVASRPFLTDIFLDDLVSVPHYVLEQVALIAGHLGYEARQLLPARFATCVVLRDPVERTLSHYAHLRRNPTVKAESPDFSLEEFLESPRWRTLAHDYQARHLVHEVGLADAWRNFSPEDAIRDLGPSVPAEQKLPLQSLFDRSPLSVPADDLLGQARRRLDSLEFVGVTEHLDALFAKVARSWGVPNPGPLARLQVGDGQRPQAAELPRRLVKRIEESTTVDMELYEGARMKVEGELAAAGS